jgi:L,D-transpeptidase ErfK/SrfK
MGRLTRLFLFSAAASLCNAPVHAVAGTETVLPSIMGQEIRVKALFEHTFADLAEAYQLGFNEMVQANPGIDPWLPQPGTEIIIPARRILPPGPRNGIVVNLSEYRLYYYPANRGDVITHPIGIGTTEFPTPVIDTSVVAKVDKPAWYPPASIRKRQLEEEGEVMPLVVPPGPENPLGAFAMKLAADSYLIHGTNKGMGIGMAVSHGCIRMNNADVLSLAKLVPVGTVVKIMREPVKVAVEGGIVWAEVHPDEQVSKRQVIDSMAAQVQSLSVNNRGLQVDSKAVRDVIGMATGRPQIIGRLQPTVAAVP